jgi:hypothetical protein
MRSAQRIRQPEAPNGPVRTRGLDIDNSMSSGIFDVRNPAPVMVASSCVP